MSESFIDLHCHLLPGIDDGAADWDESLSMARMAAADGIGVVVATPHQCGGFAQNDAGTIRRLVVELNERVSREGIPLRVFPGGDVRVEADLVERLERDEVLSLADTGRYVLLELPHEVYVPLDRLLAQLSTAGYQGILSHPERNQGILADLELVGPLVAKGCLMQVTADSLVGNFGRRAQSAGEEMIGRGWVHFVSTDAHSTAARKPVLRPAFERLLELTDRQTALDLCCRNPAQVVAGTSIAQPCRTSQPAGPLSWLGWLTGKQSC